MKLVSFCLCSFFCMLLLWFIISLVSTYGHSQGLFVSVLVGLCGLYCTCFKKQKTVQTVPFFPVLYFNLPKTLDLSKRLNRFLLTAVSVFILVSPVVAHHAVSSLLQSLVFTFVWLPSVCFSVATPHFPVTLAAQSHPSWIVGPSAVRVYAGLALKSKHGCSYKSEVVWGVRYHWTNITHYVSYLPSL